MAGKSSRSEILSNPFFVLLLATSALFVLTVLGYLVSPYVLVPNPVQGPQSARSIAIADWFDRHGPMTLAIEFVVMLLAGVLAMVTDPWFTSRPKVKQRGGEA